MILKKTLFFFVLVLLVVVLFVPVSAITVDQTFRQFQNPVLQYNAFSESVPNFPYMTVEMHVTYDLYVPNAYTDKILPSNLFIFEDTNKEASWVQEVVIEEIGTPPSYLFDVYDVSFSSYSHSTQLGNYTKYRVTFIGTYNAENSLYNDETVLMCCRPQIRESYLWSLTPYYEPYSLYFGLGSATWAFPDDDMILYYCNPWFTDYKNGVNARSSVHSSTVTTYVQYGNESNVALDTMSLVYQQGGVNRLDYVTFTYYQDESDYRATFTLNAIEERITSSDSIAPAVYSDMHGDWFPLRCIAKSGGSSLTPTGSSSSDIDVSEYYLPVNITADPQTWVSAVPNLVNNMLVWVFCCMPILNKITAPLFLTFRYAGNFLLSYLVPLLSALGIFGGMLGLAIIVKIIIHNISGGSKDD